MAALHTLPNELLSLVANHLERPKDLVSLALSNRRLNEFTKLDGWKAFLKGRFRLYGLDTDARNTVHGLTTLYNNCNRKGFVARYLEPSTRTTSLNTWQNREWRGPTGQTMGYQPCIDSYEETNGAWTDRREVLAWSAGTQVVLRMRETGNKALRAWEDKQRDEKDFEKSYVFDQFRHQNHWYSYQIPGSLEGRDDITAMKLLRPHQKNGTSEHIAIGTASGDLSILSADTTLRETDEWAYDTGERPVTSISISSAEDPLMAATLGDSALALYPIIKDYESEASGDILSEVTPISAARGMGRIWSCNFVSDDKVAVGLGPSYEPIHVYEITPSGFLSEPLRKFSLDTKYWAGAKPMDWGMQRSTSVYPVLPLPADPHSTSATSDLFLSGGYDGIVRLHDMRSPRGFESLFWDVTNDSAVYSLACQGLERFVVGSSMHSMLKVFDLRFPGSNAYHYVPIAANPPPRRPDFTHNDIVHDARAATTALAGGWNLFLNPREPVSQGGNRHQSRRRPREDGPVYSLSIPSSTSPNIYAGLEGAIQNLTFVSVTDEHQDSLLAQGITRFEDSNNIDIKSSYNPTDDVLNLGMYEQGNEEGVGMQLLVQDGVRSALAKNKERKDFARHRGLDDRWKDPAEDGQRWVRGQVPPPNARRDGGGREPRGGARGRGRGRGRGGRGRG